MHAGMRWTTVAVATVLVAILGACGGGTIDGAGLQAEVHARGGGASRHAIEAVMSGIHRELGDDPEVMRLTLTFGEVTASVTAPVTDGVDQFSFRRDRLLDQSPQVIDPTTGPPASVPLDTFALDRVEEMADAALAEVDLADAWVSGLAITVDPATIQLTVNSVRNPSVTVDFTAEGELIPRPPR